VQDYPQKQRDSEILKHFGVTKISTTTDLARFFIDRLCFGARPTAAYYSTPPRLAQ
jgi:hypothetical protein